MIKNEKITVVFLIYNDARYVPQLTEAILGQRHPNFQNQGDWLEVTFLDNGSRDGTSDAVRENLKRIGSPEHMRLEVNPVNLGISGALNKVFQTAQTPYVLICHCDVVFARSDYVAQMLEFMIRRPEAGVITGQPAVLKRKTIPFAEKVNLITNLMDIFPPETSEELLPVGFAESRCDVFRVSALESVGYYDTTLKLAGEDQVLASKLRLKGFKVYQAPRLTYYLSVSSDQDTLSRLVKHQRLFGRAHPYILLKNRDATAGVLGKAAGKNRQARTLLRLLQVLSCVVYVFGMVGLAASLASAPFVPWWAWFTPVVATFIAKGLIFFKHLKAVPLRGSEYPVFFGLQVLLDFSYSLGLAQGLLLLTQRPQSRSIS